MASRMSCPWFVGRTDELQQLIVALEATIAGSATACSWAGMPGSASRASSPSWASGRRRAAPSSSPVSASTSPTAAAPYAPVHEVLAQLDDGGGDGETTRPAEALPAALRRVAAERPVVVVVEDVHWADRSTRDLLTVLAGGPPIPRVLLVATYRADGLERGHPMRSVLAELDRADRVQHLRLGAVRPGRPRRAAARHPRGATAGLVGGCGARAIRRQPVLRRGARRRLRRGRHPARAPRAAARPPRSSRQAGPARRASRRRRRSPDRPSPARRRRRAAGRRPRRRFA